MPGEEHIRSSPRSALVHAGEQEYLVCVPHAESDYIQAGLIATGRPYEERMLEAMAGVLQPDDLVLDIGANIGNHTLYLAAIVRCRVIAFEPNSELVAGLRASVSLNRLEERVTVREVGVHSSPGRGSMNNLNPSNLGAQSVRVDERDGEFDVVAIDDEDLPGRVTAIKVDVEGAELAVLRGARNVLERDRPVLFVECGTVDEFRTVAEYLAPLGYSLRGTYNLTPTHSFAPSSGTQEEDAVSRGFVEATAELYALKSEQRRLRAESLSLRDEVATLMRNLGDERSDSGALRKEAAGER
jgi:FkbM family methyltransferase